MTNILIAEHSTLSLHDALPIFGKSLAIVLDGELYSAPVIHGEIPNGRGQISGGNFTVQSAYELANVLQNPLEAPVHRPTDRKSTRLNSSHRCISYAVFCLKKNK